jgi:hypothetical protein
MTGKVLADVNREAFARAIWQAWYDRCEDTYGPGFVRRAAYDDCLQECCGCEDTYGPPDWRCYHRKGHKGPHKGPALLGNREWKGATIEWPNH